MRYPEFLKENGTIEFVAPSFGCATEPYKSAFDHALSEFQKSGYQTLLGENCYVAEGIGISNDPKLCGEELNRAYCEDQSNALISCGGGELMCEVVPFIDFERISKSTPKWFMGYSDNTNFTFLSATLADTAAIYGPCAGAFGMQPWHESITDAFELLCGKRNAVHGYTKWEKESLKDEEHPFLPYHVTEDTCYRILRTASDGRLVPDDLQKEDKVHLEGRLLGGCLDCLVNLLGTEYDKVDAFIEHYNKEKIIWFLEACDLNVMSMRRAIWQMKHAGWFSSVGGFLIGRPYHMGEEMFGIDHLRAVTDLLAEYEVPILLDLDIGHLAPMMPLICGASAKVDVANKQIQIEYTWK